jgi:hypothetical protein
MADVTFRDFAGAVMGNDVDKAASVLAELLGLDDARARAAAAHFQTQMKQSPDFMMKAMGLRTAVTSGSDDAIRSLLGDCFGLEGDDVTTAVDALRRRYPA